MSKIHLKDEKELTELLQSRRRELKLTQKDVAKFARLSHNGLSQIELGNSDVKLSTLFKLSRILGFKITLEMEP